jgi:hypothetical protein
MAAVAAALVPALLGAGVRVTRNHPGLPILGCEYTLVWTASAVNLVDPPSMLVWLALAIRSTDGGVTMFTVATEQSVEYPVR